MLARCRRPADHAEDMSGVTSAAQIAAVVNEQCPDVVALQEVDRLADRTGRVDFVGPPLPPHKLMYQVDFV